MAEQKSDAPETVLGAGDKDKPVDERKEFAWNDGWREKIAKGDEKVAGRLQRFQSPEDIWSSYRALETKLSSGEYRAALPKDATPEQIGAWRKDSGIPDKPGDYDLTFDDGLVVGEEDKKSIEGFLGKAHAANYTPAQVKEAVRWYYEETERQTASREAMDKEILVKSQDELRNEWGQDYRTNINLIHGLMDKAPQGFKDAFLGGRLADGTPVGSSPLALKWLAMMAREINPVSTVVPGAGANQAEAIADELKKYETMMRDRGGEYWKGPRAEDHQKRYRELIEASQRSSGKASR